MTRAAESANIKPSHSNHCDHMRFSVSMQNFRCFSAIGPVPIAPVTLLIGENSSGKTAFLAGLRHIVESFTSSNLPSFNKEPYFLGSFEQIAHYRGGKAGRAKSFCLSVHFDGELKSPDTTAKNRISRAPSSHHLTFHKGSTEPDLVGYKMEAGGISARFELQGSKPRIHIDMPDGQTIEIDNRRMPSSSILRRELGMLGYFVEDAASGNRREGDLAPATKEVIQGIGHALQAASRLRSQEVFASAPVRIQPRRVYTPSELSSLNAGEQVPLEMAREKLLAPAHWAKTRATLAGFGHKSGLFEDIDVKRLGKSDSDPFQLQVKNKGPASNIVDVGYGVSQALPLIYPLQNSLRYNIYLVQQPEVHLHPRAQAEFGSLIVELSREHHNNNYIIETHSDYIVDRIRAEVRDKKLSSKNVSILLFRRRSLGTEIIQMGLDEYGEVSGYPDDYREFFLEEQAKILGL